MGPVIDACRKAIARAGLGRPAASRGVTPDDTLGQPRAPECDSTRPDRSVPYRGDTGTVPAASTEVRTSIRRRRFVAYDPNLHKSNFWLTSVDALRTLLTGPTSEAGRHRLMEGESYLPAFVHPWPDLRWSGIAWDRGALPPET